MRGDVLEYTIIATNTGNDSAVKTVLVDPLPAGVTYVPGTIQITAGANAGMKTDAAGDDQAEYDAANRRIVVRLGTGADSTQGGTVGIGESSTIKFRVTIDQNASGVLANQAQITADGLKGNPTTTYPSGNGITPGSPTTTPVDECDMNNPCPAARPICVMTTHPFTCAECTSDANCGAVDSGRVCDATLTCVDGCRGSGGNGCPAGKICTSIDNSIGLCLIPGLDAGLDVNIDVTGAGGAGGAAGAVGAAGAAGAGGAGGAGGATGASGAGGTAGVGGAAGAAGANADGSAGSAAGGAAGAGGARDAGGGETADEGGTGGGGSSGAGGAGGTDGSAGAGGALDASSEGVADDASIDDAALSDASDAGSDGRPNTDASTPPDGAGLGGSVEGGGCACTTPGSRSTSPFDAALLVALAIAGRRRRRRGRRALQGDGES